MTALGRPAGRTPPASFHSNGQLSVAIMFAPAVPEGRFGKKRESEAATFLPPSAGGISYFYTFFVFFM